MKTDFLKITKRQAKLIFLIFSVLLVADYPILPLLIGVLEKTNNCSDYDNFLTCAGVSFLFFVILATVWCFLWYSVYEIFFMSDEEREKLRKSKYFLVRLKMKNIDYVSYVHGKELRKNPTIVLVTLFCLGVGYAFILELYNIVKIIFL